MIAASHTGLDVAELVQGLSRLHTLSSDVGCIWPPAYLVLGFAEWLNGPAEAILGWECLTLVLPLLRPLRLLRLASLLRVLIRKASTALPGKVAIYAGPDRNIVSIGDAIWWAITTTTTVGYADRYPTTGIGRIVAVAI
jgi:hypothetical protein